MSLRVAGLAPLCLLLLGCPGTRGEQATDANSARMLYADTVCSASTDTRAAWVNSGNELATSLRALSRTAFQASAPDVPEVDFIDDSVLVLQMGQRPTGGYALRLAQARMVVEDGTAMVRIEWIEPPPGAFVTQALTSPCLVLAVPRGDYVRLKVVDQDDQIRFDLQVP